MPDIKPEHYVIAMPDGGDPTRVCVYGPFSLDVALTYKKNWIPIEGWEMFLVQRIPSEP